MPGESRTREPKLVEVIAWTAASHLAARTYEVSMARVIDCRGRQTRATGALLLARRAALYLAHVGGNLPIRALCRATSMDHKTIERHVHAVEDDREWKVELDALMDELTARLQAGLAPLGQTGAAKPEPLILPAPARRRAA